MRERVLVTGGAGVVGSHLVDRLLATGREVIAVDDLSCGSFANVAHLRREPRFAFLEHDVAKPFHADVDRIFHLAVPSTRRGCEADPIKAAMTCVAGTVNVLEVAQRRHARVVVATSTDRWGEGLRCAESLAIHAGRASASASASTSASASSNAVAGASVASDAVRLVRAARVYGPRVALDGSDLVGTMILAALRGDDLARWLAQRPEERVRLSYVDDVVETLVGCMEADVPVATVVAPMIELRVAGLALAIAELAAQRTGGPRPAFSAPRAAAATAPRSDRSPPVSEPLSQRDPSLEAQPAAEALDLGPATLLLTGLERTMRWIAARTAGIRRDGHGGVFPSRPPAAPFDALPHLDSVTRASRALAHLRATTGDTPMPGTALLSGPATRRERTVR